MPDIDTTAVSGVEARGYRRGSASTDGWDQYVVPVRDRITTFNGRASTFRVPSRAAATQNVLSLYNNSATVIVAVNRILFDMYQLTAGALTVHPPIVRTSRFTTLHTNGTAVGKVGLDTTQTSDSAVTVLGDASADGTSSGTALTVTIPANNVLTQEFGSRIAGGAGTNPIFEPADRMEFFVGQPDVILRQGQGINLHLVFQTAPVAGTATVGLHYIGVVDWEEYTRP